LSAAKPNILDPRETYTDAGWFVPSLRGNVMRRFCPEPPGARRVSKMIAPPGILVVEGFLGSAICEEWCSFMDKQPTQQLSVQNVSTFKDSGEMAWEAHEARITETIDLAEKKNDVLREVVRGYRDYATRFFETDLDTIEQPSVLKYLPGGRYNAHSDSEYWSDEDHQWIRSLERDYSILLYLNDGFEGGALFFPNFNFRLEPQRGMLVAFPSDHRYLHAAEPLLSGVRFAVVSWAKAKISQPFSPFIS